MADALVQPPDTDTSCDPVYPWPTDTEIEDLYTPFDPTHPGVGFLWDPALVNLWTVNAPVETPTIDELGPYADYMAALEDGMQMSRIDREFLLYWLLRSYHANSKPIFLNPQGKYDDYPRSYETSHTWGGSLSALYAYFTGACEIPQLFKSMWDRQLALNTNQYTNHRKTIWDGFLILYFDSHIPPHMKDFFDEYALLLKLYLFNSDTLIVEEGFAPI